MPTVGVNPFHWLRTAYSRTLWLGMDTHQLSTWHHSGSLTSTMRTLATAKTDAESRSRPRVLAGNAPAHLRRPGLSHGRALAGLGLSFFTSTCCILHVTCLPDRLLKAKPRAGYCCLYPSLNPPALDLASPSSFAPHLETLVLAQIRAYRLELPPPMSCPRR